MTQDQAPADTGAAPLDRHEHLAIGFHAGGCYKGDEVDAYIAKLRAEVDHLKAEREFQRGRADKWVEIASRRALEIEELHAKAQEAEGGIAPPDWLVKMSPEDIENWRWCHEQQEGGIAPRVLALARAQALRNHSGEWFMAGSRHDGTYHDNSTCPHPDCHAVRSPHE